MNFSLNEVLDFFNYAEQKGLQKPNTARANKAVIARVSSVLDMAEQVHMSELSAEEIYRRFVTKFATKLSPDSMRVYKSRFLSAIDCFKQWKESPEGFSTAQKPSNESILPTKSWPSVGQQQTTRPLLPEVPVPLTDGLFARVVGLPADLTVAEAERFKKIIDSYICEST